MNQLIQSFKSCHINVTDRTFWYNLRQAPLKNFVSRTKYILSEWGTTEPCNRFDIGNSIEILLGQMIENECNYKVKQLPNAKRIDMCIEDEYPLSIKWSRTGDITLHNSNSCINKDVHMTDLLLLEPEYMWLITNNNLKEVGIDVNAYLVNKGDSLKLKRSILTQLHKKEFKYKRDVDLVVSECKHRLCAELFLKQAMLEYDAKYTPVIKRRGSI